MKHISMGQRHAYETDVVQTAELLIRRLMEQKYWFDVQHSEGKYTITCGCEPKFVYVKFRMLVDGYVPVDSKYGTYKHKIAA